MTRRGTRPQPGVAPRQPPGREGAQLPDAVGDEEVRRTEQLVAALAVEDDVSAMRAPAAISGPSMTIPGTGSGSPQARR